ncbi:hypothetical protein [Clostridium butyricum]|uniref:hypothetical protein n=1 Tax=Clostridium butyricum TaxID=1492 RepID=UPI0003A58703|nr:hypothetical protein [Clostridium butyricum]MBZ5747016.1 hypothetical protein [Clostridium butyricum]MDI9207893.1 hypothetical protein [Clostridium butyricum]BBK75861.1 hypothetical protein Cbu04g_08690 [Clostridium butyricum]GEQ26202.1 hypothetical protein CBU03nite_26250 [Clostridium butyricum]
MATKSICKNVNLKDKTLTRGLVIALENASNKQGKEVQMSKSVKEIKGKDLLKIFN